MAELAAHATFMWNAGGVYGDEWKNYMECFRSNHDLSLEISNDPNNWIKAELEEVFATWINCDHF